jgi:hypothetical protein
MAPKNFSNFQPRGEVTKLGKNTRMVVPVEVRRAVEWLSGNKSIDLISELVEPGLIRVHQAGVLHSLIEKQRQKITDEHANPLEKLAILNDRYRPISYYPSDTRLRLTPSIVAFLAPNMKKEELLYVEYLSDHLEIMTLDHRNRRLRMLSDELELYGEFE